MIISDILKNILNGIKNKLTGKKWGYIGWKEKKKERLQKMIGIAGIRIEGLKHIDHPLNIGNEEEIIHYAENTNKDIEEELKNDSYRLK